MRCKPALHHPTPLVRSLKNELWCQMPSYKWYVDKQYLEKEYQKSIIPWEQVWDTVIVEYKKEGRMNELEDLAKMYQEKIKEIKDKIETFEPIALMRMTTLIQLKKELSDLTVKLLNLNYKMGKSQEEDDEDGE